MLPEYQRKIDDIHTALIGNEYGQKGLIKRIVDIENQQEDDKKLKYKVIGAGAVMSFIGSSFVTWLFKHF